MGDRAQQLEEFLVVQGVAAAPRAPLAGDASTRRYVRLGGAKGDTIVMDAPPGDEAPACPPTATLQERRALGYNALACLAGPNCAPFVAVANYLTSLGLSAPKIHGADLEHGFLLLEDLGDGLFADVVEAGGEEDPLYRAAIDVLVHLHESPCPRVLPVAGQVMARQADYGLKTYDAVALQVEADLLLDWYVPLVTGDKIDEAARQDYTALWQEVWPLLTAQPVLVLRDYHAQNLLWLPQRQGLARVGLLDFQDAVLGGAGYDLVSLLEDARRDVPPKLASSMLDYYCVQRSRHSAAFDEEAFRLSYALLGAQRNAKIIGIFARLWMRDDKPHYLEHLPRVWRYLEGDLSHPALHKLKAWFNDHIPLDRRTTIPSV